MLPWIATRHAIEDALALVGLPYDVIVKITTTVETGRAQELVPSCMPPLVCLSHPWILRLGGMDSMWMSRFQHDFLCQKVRNTKQVGKNNIEWKIALASSRVVFTEKATNRSDAEGSTPSPQQWNREIANGKWTDYNKDGFQWYRNCMWVYDDTAPVPTDDILAYPFGYGVTLFRGGRLAMPITEEFSKDAAEKLANVIEKDAPFGTRVMLGIELNETDPVHARGIQGGDVVLAVWGVDQTALDRTRAKIKEQDVYNKNRGNVFTMRMVATLPQIKHCTAQSKDYRCKLAARAREALGLQPGRVDMPGSRWLCMHVGDKELDYETVRLRFDRASAATSAHAHTPMASHTVQLFSDAVHPSMGGAIFHSPSRGLTVYYPRQEAQTKRDYAAGHDVAIPASDGRNLPLPDKPLATGARSSHVAIVHQTDDNTYDSADYYERTYVIPAPEEVEACNHEVAHCNRLQIAPVAVACASNLSSTNGKLYGHTAVDTMEAAMKYVHPESSHFHMPDDPSWQQHLKSILPDRNTMAFLCNAEFVTPSMDQDGCLVGYCIDRNYLNNNTKEKKIE